MACLHRLQRCCAAARSLPRLPHLPRRSLCTPGGGGEGGEDPASPKARMAALLASLRKEGGPEEAPRPRKLGLDLARPKPPKGRSLEAQRAERALVGLDKDVAESVAAVAEAVGGGASTQHALLSKLQEARGGEARGGDVKALLASMAKESPKAGGGDRRGSLRRPTPAHYAPFPIFGAKPLGIFPSSPLPEPSEEQSTLERCHAKTLQQSVLREPTNWFEEQLQWTEQGKTWHFPVDNEFGMEEEAAVGFHEHVFLTRHLEAWCPRVGPIRHHMELVCHGLSVNPYMRVERKRAIIEWHRDFFEERRATLEAVGAYPKKAEASV